MIKCVQCQHKGDNFFCEAYKEEINKSIIKCDKFDEVEKPQKDQHYKEFPELEAFKLMRDSFTSEQYRGFLLGNILKYRMRIGKKKGQSVEEELRKIKVYENELRRFENGNN